MSYSSSSSSSGGIGFVGLLTILFIALKLFGVTIVVLVLLGIAFWLAMKFDR